MLSSAILAFVTASAANLAVVTDPSARVAVATIPSGIDEFVLDKAPT
jgi:hypothetical protein